MCFRLAKSFRHILGGRQPIELGRGLGGLYRAPEGVPSICTPISHRPFWGWGGENFLCGS